MFRKGILLALFALMGLVYSGCTTSTAQQGAAIGAAGGAILGQVIGRDTKSTIIGAAVGGLTGALVGDKVGRDNIERERLVKEAADARREAEELRSNGEERPVRTAATYPSGRYEADPTIGEFANDTRWRVKVYVDSPTNDFKKTPFLALGPYETAPVNLDVGEHRITAVAFVSTQYGERMVGRFDEVIVVDPRQEGWSIIFDNSSFN